MRIDDPKTFFAELGGLQGVTIRGFCYDVDRDEFVVDIEAQQGGRTETPSPCTLIFQGVDDLLLDLTTDQDLRVDNVEISPHEFGRSHLGYVYVTYELGFRIIGRLSSGGGALTEGVSFDVTFRALEVVDRPPRNDRGGGI